MRMEVLQPHPIAERVVLAAPANDACLHRPVLQVAPLHPALRHPQLPRRALAALLTLSFCLWWVVLRAAAPAEIDALRLQLAAESGPAAVARFDAALASHPQASLLRMEWLRLGSRS
jgi:hypothetical protein